MRCQRVRRGGGQTEAQDRRERFAEEFGAAEGRGGERGGDYGECDGELAEADGGVEGGVGNGGRDHGDGFGGVGRRVVADWRGCVRARSGFGGV